MIRSVLKGRSDAVDGAPICGAETRYLSYRQAVGNRGRPLDANVLFDCRVTDLHTSLKLVPVEVFRRLELTKEGFGLDTEITAKLLAMRFRPFEVPVSYHGRFVHQGKKMIWRDGAESLQILAKERSNRLARAALAAESVTASLETLVEEPIARLAVSIATRTGGHPDLAHETDSDVLRSAGR